MCQSLKCAKLIMTTLGITGMRKLPIISWLIGSTAMPSVETAKSTFRHLPTFNKTWRPGASRYHQNKQFGSAKITFGTGAAVVTSFVPAAKRVLAVESISALPPMLELSAAVSISIFLVRLWAMHGGFLVNGNNRCTFWFLANDRWLCSTSAPFSDNKAPYILMPLFKPISVNGEVPPLSLLFCPTGTQQCRKNLAIFLSHRVWKETL